MDEKTVKQHLEACRSVESLIDDSNALVTRLQTALQRTRETLERLQEYQHPKLMMTPPFHLTPADSRSRDVSPNQVIKAQIEQVNALLGDRA